MGRGDSSSSSESSGDEDEKEQTASSSSEDDDRKKEETGSNSGEKEETVEETTADGDSTGEGEEESTKEQVGESVSITDDEEESSLDIKIQTDEEFFASLSESEIRWYNNHRTSPDELETRKIECTACFKQVNHKKNRGSTFRHPLLGVVICKSCLMFYFDGEWKKDEEGSHEYCGWCANGGELLCCATEG